MMFHTLLSRIKKDNEISSYTLLVISHHFGAMGC